ncbi:MAG: hypothetical protein SFU98_11040 [Leptospiraceae bacterium]|nr:hypothetical protein [Leptospiraceae bacterium]
MDTSSFKTIMLRISSKVEKLESVTNSISSEMQKKKSDRDEWYNWHKLWKKAWFSNSKELSQEETEKLKEETSATTRYKAIDI